MSKLKKFITATSLSFTAFTGYHFFGAYQYSKSPSGFERGASKLGFNGSKKFSKEEQQEALLNIFYINGYLKPEEVWKYIHKIGKIENPEKVFVSTYKAIKRAGADQESLSKFDPKSLRKNLFKDSGLDDQDVADFILYIAQNAFNRKIGQQRTEITKENWMDKYPVEYLQSAKKLGMIDSIEPEFAEYNALWVAGASRVGMLARLIQAEYLTNTKGIEIMGPSLVLASERELWPNIDGINPQLYNLLLKIKQNKTSVDEQDIIVPVGEDPARTAEGREYIQALARKYNIKLDPYKPFIQYKAGQCPPGKFPDRDYANYSQDGQKLTERLMAKDLMKTFFFNQSMEITHTQDKDNPYPTTSTTVSEAAEIIIRGIKAGVYGVTQEFKVMYVTNNPYIPRQTLTAQLEVNKLLSKYGLDKQGYIITIEGVGYGNKQDIALISSEVGALVAVRRKAAELEDTPEGILSKREIDTLLYQTRDKTTETPSYPSFGEDPELNIKGQLVDIFDEYT